MVVASVFGGGPIGTRSVDFMILLRVALLARSSFQLTDYGDSPNTLLYSELSSKQLRTNYLEFRMSEQKEDHIVRI